MSTRLWMVATLASGLLIAAGAAGARSSFQSNSNAASASDTGTEQVDLRSRTQPGVWTRGAVRKFRTVLDRASARSESVSSRATRRAYDGAPPVMPHTAIFGEGTKDCLDCHSEGMKLGTRVAHPMSHPPLANCVQCHVESSNRLFPPGEDPATHFEGLPSAGAGPRQTELAPPQIPHHVTMRGLCLSCHGEFGYPGIRTEHPERSNCVQCHVTAYRSR